VERSGANSSGSRTRFDFDSHSGRRDITGILGELCTTSSPHSIGWGDRAKMNQQTRVYANTVMVWGSMIVVSATIGWIVGYILFG
jgi:hypothetical protein